MTPLIELLADCRNGQGFTALVGGAPGIGKTHLVNECARRAAQDGATVLTADARDTSTSLTVIGQLLEAAPPESAASRLRGLQPTSPETASPGGADKLPQRAWAAFRELSRRAPLVIVVDDVEFADPLSKRCLCYIMRRCHTAPVGVILSTCASSPEPMALVPQLASCHRLWLPLLSPCQTAAFLADQLGAPVPEGLARTYHALTGGNPLLVISLLEDHKAIVGLATGESRPVSPATLVPGTIYRAALRRCLSRGPASMGQVAQAMAVLGDDVPLDVIGELVDSDPPSVATLVRHLEMTGVLEAGRFAHPEVRASILADIGATERGRLHRGAARLLYERGFDTTRIAGHLLDGGAVDGPWVIPVLQEAARSALAGRGTSQAIAYLDAALKRAAAGDRAEILADLAMAEWRLSPTRVVRLLPEIRKELAAASPTGVSISLIKQLLWLGRHDDVRPELRRISESGGVLPSELHQLRTWLTVHFPPLAADLEAAGGSDRAQTRRSPGSRQRVDALTALRKMAENDHGTRTVDWAEQLLAGAQLTDTSYEKIQRALLALLYTDNLDLAARWCERFLAEASSRQAPTWVAGLTSVLAEVACRRGDLRRAETHIAQVFEQVPMWAWNAAIGGPLATKINVATARGALGEVEQLLQRPLPAGMDRSRLVLRYLNARGNYHLAAAHPLVALEDFHDCGELAVSWGLDLPGLVAWRSGAAAAWLAVGERRRAEELLAEQLTKPGAGRPRIHGVSLRLMAAALTDARQRHELALRAVDLLHRSGDRLEHARALLALSSYDRALGRPEADAEARRAFTMAEQCGAEPLMLQARSALEAEDSVPGPAKAEDRRFGRDNRMFSRLSDAEFRVALLAAHGNSNTQIARRLEITVSTVEQHLTRVYRKLEVQGRTHLPVELRLAELST